MTEEEAKMHDCIGPAPCGYEFSIDTNPGKYAPIWITRRCCKGSACAMAWRWIDHGGPLVDGYCGLAGKP
jgi:hypothetical protein